MLRWLYFMLDVWLLFLLLVAWKVANYPSSAKGINWNVIAPMVAMCVYLIWVVWVKSATIQSAGIRCVAWIGKPFSGTVVKAVIESLEKQTSSPLSVDRVLIGKHISYIKYTCNEFPQTRIQSFRSRIIFCGLHHLTFFPIPLPLPYQNHTKFDDHTRNINTNIYTLITHSIHSCFVCSQQTGCPCSIDDVLNFRCLCSLYIDWPMTNKYTI